MPSCRTLVPLLSLLLVPAVGSSSGAEEPELLGFWESVDVSQGGIGAALRFLPDGRLQRVVVVQVDGTYRLEGDQLFVRLAGGAEQELPLDRLEEGVMEATLPDGESVVMRRIRMPRQTASPIVGDWTYSHLMGKTAYERYTSDGRLFFRFPMWLDEGRYEVRGDGLRVTLDEGREEWVWDLEGDELLVGPRGRPSRFRRVEDGAWYLETGSETVSPGARTGDVQPIVGWGELRLGMPYAEVKSRLEERGVPVIKKTDDPVGDWLWDESSAGVARLKVDGKTATLVLPAFAIDWHPAPVRAALSSASSSARLYFDEGQRLQRIGIAFRETEELSVVDLATKVLVPTLDAAHRVTDPTPCSAVWTDDVSDRRIELRCGSGPNGRFLFLDYFEPASDP